MSMNNVLAQEFQVNDCVAYAAKGPLDNLTVSGTMVCLASAAKEEPFEGPVAEEAEVLFLDDCVSFFLSYFGLVNSANRRSLAFAAATMSRAAAVRWCNGAKLVKAALINDVTAW